MKKNSLPILLMMLFLLFFLCSKKEKEKEGVLVQPEQITVKVEVPKVSWEKSIAVLPVKHVADSARSVIIASVLTEQLTSTLAKTHKLRVVSPSSAEWLEKSGLEPDYILKADLGQQDKNVTLSLNLMDAKKDSSVWENEGTMEDIFIVTERVSGSVSEWFAFDSVDSSVSESISSDVMNLYLEGKGHLLKRTREDTDLAVIRFKEALKMDSTFAPASVALAESYLQINHNIFIFIPT